MPVRLAVLLLLAACLPNVGDAALVYRFINYPDLQSGYTFDGTITVADTASNDGVLSLDEVLYWSWTATGPRSLTGQFQANPQVPYEATVVIGIQIDSAGIYLPLGTQSRLSLDEYTNQRSRGFNFRRLYWVGGSATAVPWHALVGVDEGDIGLRAWGKAVPMISARWTIAAAVPEPTTLLLSCFPFAILAYNHRRRTTTSSSKKPAVSSTPPAPRRPRR